MSALASHGHHQPGKGCGRHIPPGQVVEQVDHEEGGGEVRQEERMVKVGVGEDVLRGITELFVQLLLINNISNSYLFFLFQSLQILYYSQR